MRARLAGVALAIAAVVAAASCSSGSHDTTATVAPPTLTATTSAPPAGLARVDIFGDSLVVQAGEALRVEGRAHGLNVTVAAYFGLAPCDLLSSIEKDLARPPRALVIAFSGNNITPCMTRGGHDLVGAPYYAIYRRDVSAIVALATARKVPVLIVGPPRFGALKNIPDRVALAAIYAQIAAKYPGVRYVSAVAAVSPHGFTPTLPCGPGETAALGCHDDIITVRAPDQIHFDEPHTVPCPSGHDTCRYSAGAHRFAGVIFAALAPIIGPHYVPAAATVGVPIDMTRNG
jgi:hypothetical protein